MRPAAASHRGERNAGIGPARRRWDKKAPVMGLQAFFFYLFAFVAVASAFMVVSARNPVYSVLFLILTFFIMATKFKPPEPVPIKTPSSVSSDKLKETDALLIEIDSTGRTFFTMNLKSDPQKLKRKLIKNISDTRGLGLTENEYSSFEVYPTIGVPFSKLKSVMSVNPGDRNKQPMEGIPSDSTNNELDFWIRDASVLLSDRSDIEIMIKADNKTKYPAFRNVVETLRKNNQLKYQLITIPEGVPPGTELYRQTNQQ